VATYPKLRAVAQPTLVDFAFVESGIRKHCVDGSSRGIAFARYVLGSIFQIAESEINDHIVDGGSDRGVDAIFIDHEHRLINICSCKSVAHFEKTSKNFPGKEVDKILSFVDDVLLKNEEILSEANGDLSARVREIWEIFEAGDAYRICVHLFSNQLSLAESERDRLLDRIQKYKIEVKEHGLYELAHGVIRALKPKFKKKLITLRDSTFEVRENGHRGLQTRVALEFGIG
jgi:hypothetical protein